MIYPIIYSYFCLIILFEFYNIDYQFMLVSFIILTFFYMSFMIYKGQLKDMSFMKQIPKYLLMSFILIALFINLDRLGYKEIGEIFDQEFYQVVGKIRQVSYGNNVVNYYVEVEQIKSLSDNTNLNLQIKHLIVTVSPKSEYELFDKVNIIGELNIKNFENYFESKPLIFFHEYEDLGNNSLYQISFPRSINKVGYKKSLYETLYLKVATFNYNLQNTINNYMSEPYAQIAVAITFGIKDNLIKDIKDMFTNSGLIHLLVLSGTNVSFIISLIYFLFRNFSTRLKIFNTLFFTTVFIISTGINPPAVRAGLVSTLTILGEYFGKNISNFKILILSLFVISIFSPFSLIYNASLHLSYLAFFAIFVANEIIQKSFPIFQKNILYFTLLTAINIFIFTTPYILNMTGSSSLFGVILTVFAEPFILLSMILNFLIILFSRLDYLFGISIISEILGILNNYIVSVIYNLAYYGSNYLSVFEFKISNSFLLFYYILLFLLYYYFDSKNSSESKNTKML